MKKSMQYQGFAFIEMLVVVIVVGILSAIALPMYQKAILKSKMAQLSAIMQTLKEAEELYWLHNGCYTGAFADLDISMSGIYVSTNDPGFIYVGDNKDMRVDLFADYPRWITTLNSPGALLEGTVGNKTGKRVGIILYLNHSAYPNQRFCRGDEKKCKILGGQPTSIRPFSWTLWKLP